MELALMHPYHPGVFVGAPQMKNRLPRSPLRTALSVLAGRYRVEGSMSPFMAEMPLLQSVLATRAHLRGVLDDWEREGVTTLGDIFEGDKVKTRVALMNVSGRTLRTAFATLQLYSLFRHHWNNSLSRPVESQTLSLVYRVRGWGRPLTHLHEGLSRLQHSVPIKAKAKWEADLGRELTDMEWSKACKHVKEVGVAMRYRVIQYKYMVRYYMTPMRIAKFAPDYEALCPRCGVQEAGFLHLIWDCVHIVRYWEAIFQELGKIIDAPLTKTIEVVFLGASCGLQGVGKKFFAMGLLLAKRELSKTWMRPKPPTLEDWIRALLYSHELEKKFVEHLPVMNRPTDIWHDFVLYLNTKNCPSDEMVGNGTETEYSSDSE